MGLYHFLVNNKNKTIFELGKGFWFIADDFKSKSELENYLYKDSCVEYIEKSLYDINNNIYDTTYYKFVADQIFDFIEGFDLEKDFSVANDADDSFFELRERQYIIIGSRYEVDARYLISMNYHLRNFDRNIFNLEMPIKRFKKFLSFI